MASIRTLFDHLTDLPPGQKLTIAISSKSEYETVRTALVKFWTTHREIIRSITDDDPFLDNALCGNYLQERSEAEFWLGKTRRKLAKEYSFVVKQIDTPKES
jgi:hypothetical protein